MAHLERFLARLEGFVAHLEGFVAHLEGFVVIWRVLWPFGGAVHQNRTHTCINHPSKVAPISLFSNALVCVTSEKS